MRKVLHYVSLRLPRSWRLAMLEALAGSEFEVRPAWVVIDPSAPGGISVRHIDLKELRTREAEAYAAL